jgi:hypothetical protein
MENNYQQQQLDIYTCAFEYAEQHNGDIAIMKAYMKGAEQFRSSGQAEKVEAISIHYGEDGKPDGIRVVGCGLDFVLALHDEFDGEDVTYEKAEKCSLPDEMMARLYGIHRKEINRLMEEAGGEPLEAWYWTKTPAEEVFGAYSVNRQLIFNGTGGHLDYNCRLSNYRVRVALALNTKVSKS